MKTQNELKAALDRLLLSGRLRKLVLSKPTKDGVIRTEGHLFEKSGQLSLQLETFTKDGKAYHRNLAAQDGAEAVFSLMDSYRQLNILSPIGEGEMRMTKSGAWLVSGKFKGLDAEPTAQGAAVATHNHEKRYILKEGVPYPFLVRLGVCGADGRIHDKKRAKFLQINRFLDNVEAVYARLPKEGSLRVLDLCCGKSYLTFAVYHYLTEIKGRSVQMLGADLKRDVIDYCESVARDVGFDGLTFLCTDIGALDVPFPPHMVLSLHACDIATDIVLAKAIVTGAEVILSTPCCQHELMGQISAGQSELKTLLAPITKHSMLRQKLCDALTDGLRCHMLEAYGYRVTVSELIDPEQTPKNLIIRAVKGRISKEEQEKMLASYQSLCALAGITPYLPTAIAAYQR